MVPDDATTTRAPDGATALTTIDGNADAAPTGCVSTHDRAPQFRARHDAARGAGHDGDRPRPLARDVLARGRDDPPHGRDQLSRRRRPARTRGDGPDDAPAALAGLPRRLARRRRARSSPARPPRSRSTPRWATRATSAPARARAPRPTPRTVEKRSLTLETTGTYAPGTLVERRWVGTPSASDPLGFNFPALADVGPRADAADRAHAQPEQAARDARAVPLLRVEHRPTRPTRSRTPCCRPAPRAHRRGRQEASRGSRSPSAPSPARTTPRSTVFYNEVTAAHRRPQCPYGRAERPMSVIAPPSDPRGERGFSMFLVVVAMLLTSMFVAAGFAAAGGGLRTSAGSKSRKGGLRRRRGRPRLLRQAAAHEPGLLGPVRRRRRAEPRRGEPDQPAVGRPATDTRKLAQAARASSAEYTIELLHTAKFTKCDRHQAGVTGRHLQRHVQGPCHRT